MIRKTSPMGRCLEQDFTRLQRATTAATELVLGHLHISKLVKYFVKITK